MSTIDAKYRKIKVEEELRVDGDKKIILRDPAIFIHSDADGSLTIEADVAVKVVNPDNRADGTLSGTPKLIKVDIGGTTYYIRGYPTVT